MDYHKIQNLLTLWKKMNNATRNYEILKIKLWRQKRHNSLKKYIRLDSSRLNFRFTYWEHQNCLVWNEFSANLSKLAFDRQNLTVALLYGSAGFTQSGWKSLPQGVEIKTFFYLDHCALENCESLNTYSFSTAPKNEFCFVIIYLF